MSEEELRAELHWVHVFKDMVFSDDLAGMGPYAAAAYLVIKAFSNADGQSFPEIEVIAQKSGMSDVQVKRQLKTLEKYGYIAKERVGRNNRYRLREKLRITGADGDKAIATWDYLPAGVGETVAELKRVLITGNLKGAKIVHIEFLQVNVNNAEAVNVQTFGGAPDAEKKIEALRAAIGKKKRV